MNRKLIEAIGDNHISTSADTPLLSNAFEKNQAILVPIRLQGAELGPKTPLGEMFSGAGL